MLANVGKKNITEDFEMLVKILEIKPIGLKVRVRWQTLLYEIFLKNTYCQEIVSAISSLF